ncbi:MAG: phosphoribosyl-ATP diphosphatase [Sandarakinorhabdus sp.]|nr:phosphoribosyl-ATP diphosphatase [Sandarakinorhabdus sp.]
MSDILERLEALIAERRRNGAASESYVARQLAKGRLKLAEKLGEEAVETVIAAVAQDDRALVCEAADLVFQLLILLGERGLSLDDVRAELKRREGQSGLIEKAGRQT